ncbi:MAG: hypothetical protein AAFY45_17400 [Bacteroidota bacterium]
MSEFKKDLIKYLLEFLIVVFGVFLGMYVNERVAQNKIDREVKKSLSYILDELEGNSRQLEYTIAYHEKIKTAYQKFKTDIPEEELLSNYFANQKYKFNKIEGWDGVHLPSYENIAFEGAKISGLTREFDIETVQSLSQIYKMLEFNGEFGKTTLDKMLSMDSDSKVVDGLSIISLLTGDVLSSEIYLKKRLDVSIKELKARHPQN